MRRGAVLAMAVLIGLPLPALGQWRSPRVVGEVTGEVISYPPDGGFTVRGEVIAHPPDGGLEAIVTNRVDTSPASAPGTSVYVTGVDNGRVLVEGPIAVSGTVATTVTNIPTVALENGTQVALTAASLATITAQTGKGKCTYVDGDPTATIGTTAANIPASPMAGRTEIIIFNHSSAPTNYLLCSAQGTATTTSAVRIESGHASQKWEGLSGGVLVSCRCVTGTCTYNYQEALCYQE